MIKILVLILLLLVPLYGCKKEETKNPVAQKVTTQGQPKETEQKLEEKKVELETYSYNPAGRPDPFLSVIEASKKEKEVEKKKKATKPTEAFDVNDLQIIAIAWDRDHHYAMVRFPDGKYFTLKEGMTIGLYGGKVIKIDPNTVVVREFIKDYKGELKPRDTILKLRKEEGE